MTLQHAVRPTFGPWPLMKNNIACEDLDAVCDLLRRDEIEPEKRDEHQLPLEDDREIGGVVEQREGFEKGLVLGSDDHAAAGRMLEPAEFDA